MTTTHEDNSADRLTIASLQLAAERRAWRWHPGGVHDWSPERWAVAMAGEAGEVCNALKKLFRIEDDLPNISEEGRQLSTTAEAIAMIGTEIADTIIYATLLAERLGIDTAAEVVKKFNATSEKYGFPDRL